MCKGVTVSGYLMASELRSRFRFAQRHCWKKRQSSIRHGLSFFMARGRGASVMAPSLRSGWGHPGTCNLRYVKSIIAQQTSSLGEGLWQVSIVCPLFQLAWKQTLESMVSLLLSEATVGTSREIEKDKNWVSKGEQTWFLWYFREASKVWDRETLGGEDSLLSCKG